MRIKNFNIFKKWWFKLAAIFLLCLIFGYLFNDLYAKVNQDKIFPGVRINEINLSRQNKEIAWIAIQKKIDQFNIQGLIYKYRDKQIEILMISQATTDPDLAVPIVTFDLDKTMADAYHFGRNNNYFNDFFDRLKALIIGEEINLIYSLDEEELANILKNNFFEYIELAVNAGYQIENNNINITPEKTGIDFDYSQIISSTHQQIINLTNQPINLQAITVYPAVYQKDITSNLINEIAEILKWPAIKLFYQDREWLIKKEVFQNWFSLSKKNKQIINQFSEKLVSDYLSEQITSEINIPLRDAKFKLTNGKVTEFEPGNDGQELLINETVEKLNQEVFENKKAGSELVVKITPTKSQVGNINDLGIKEIIGIGTSNFKGSPPNRIYNIRVGANTLNGILIEPGETFSLIKALGKIDASTGYKQELVIKGNKTVPEYGGGLCQIGTTTFRAALASGLPIIERRNHAYRVVYYEPAGTDATIYDPKPDMRFLNDTGHYILIQTKIIGYDLFFEFWGTKDGRVIEQTKPVIYNIVPPGPTKYIESEEVSGGEEKCIETPHSGADTYFNYKVTYPNSEVKEEVFRSHYIPWPKVCLVSKSPDNNNNATSTQPLN